MTHQGIPYCFPASVAPIAGKVEGLVVNLVDTPLPALPGWVALFSFRASLCFPDGSASEESTCSMGVLGLVSGWKIPGGTAIHFTTPAWIIPWIV